MAGLQRTFQRQLDCRQGKQGFTMSKGTRNGAILREEKYVNAKGVKRIKSLHATKGWRDNLDT